MHNNLMSICTFYGVSPIHAGCGAATSQVDLPIQRERHTNWPHIQASAVKGAMRSHFRDYAQEASGKKLINAIFGSDEGNDAEFDYAKDGMAATLAVTDANLLAFPMRSNVAPFVWVTCPGVLARLQQNLKLSGITGIKLPASPDLDQAWSLGNQLSGEVLLEDAIVKIVQFDSDFTLPAGFPSLERLVLISDQMFDYCVGSCTEIQTNIKIDSKTGTADDGALRYQELLPSDALLYSVVFFSGREFEGQENLFKAEMIKKYVQEVIKGYMQIGGDATLGRGICRLSWLEGGAQ